jgi:hypothetical protein
MNRKHGTIAVAFVLGALAAFGVLKLAGPTVAAAQTTNPQLEQKLYEVEKRIALLENQTSSTATPSPLHPGSPPVTSGLKNVQVNQVVVLQGEIDALKNQLGKLQTQFATHYHTWTYTQVPDGNSVLTILNCQGYGKPCTSASSLTQITVLAPANNTGQQPRQVTTKTSGPVMGGN